MTLAPKSAKIIPQKGAGAKPANSNTFIPRKAIISQTPFKTCCCFTEFRIRFSIGFIIILKKLFLSNVCFETCFTKLLQKMTII